MRRVTAVLAAVIGAGCATEGPGLAPPAAVVRAVDPSASLAIASEDVTLPVTGRSVGATVVHPTAPGIYPALLLMAGSGPTDRDWNNPLIATTNGSGKLLAEALAARGMVVLRFDKAATAGNKLPVAALTFDTYVDEGRAALAQLRARADVDVAHLFVAGHSEGGIHATRVALAEGDKIAGLVLLSAPGRSMKDVVIAQVTAQVQQAAPAQAQEILGPFTKALDDFLAGQAVDPRKATPVPGLQQLLAAFVNPATATLSRALLAFDPAPAAAQVTVPVLVVNGQKDIQVDPDADAKHLADVRKAAGKDVTLVLAPNANHVLKHEDKTIALLRADLEAVQRGYNAADRVIDAETVRAIASWLAKH
jgi:uncharacterized protein